MELNKQDSVKLQLWVDKLADLNNKCVSQNDIIEWACSIPIKPIKEIEPAPLFLYGDATIDKAIVNLIHGEASEPNAANIYGALKNNFCIDENKSDFSVQDVSVVDISVNPLGGGVANAARRNFQPAKYDMDQFQDDVMIENIKAGQKTVASEKPKIKKQQFSMQQPLTQDMIEKDEELSLMGFEPCTFDQNHFMMSDGYHDYIIDKDQLNAGLICITNESGEQIKCFDNRDDFIAFVKDDMTNADMSCTVTKEDIEQDAREADTDGQNVKFARPDTNECHNTLGWLAHVMNLFANDILFMHHYAAGDDFDSVHKVTEDLYNEALGHVDTLAEMALRCEEKIGNFGRSADYVDPNVYHSMETGAFTKEQMKKALAEQGAVLLNCFRHIDQKYDSDILSEIDTIVNFWAKEVEYKNAARMKFSSRTDNDDDDDADYDRNGNKKDKKKKGNNDYLSDSALDRLSEIESELQATRRNLPDSDRKIVDDELAEIKKIKTRNDLNKVITKEKAKQKAINEFKNAVTDNLVDVAISELPGEEGIEYYDQVLGHSIIQDHPHLDDALYNTTRALGKYKNNIGSIIKAGLRIANPMMFNSQSDLLQRVASNLRKMNFSEEQIGSVMNGNMFTGFPRDCLSVSNLTREATIRLLGSAQKAEKLLFACGMKNVNQKEEFIKAGKQAKRNFKNFANEEFSDVEAFGLPVRLAYDISNPRTFDYKDPILNKDDDKA